PRRRRSWAPKSLRSLCLERFSDHGQRSRDRAPRRAHARPARRATASVGLIETYSSASSAPMRWRDARVPVVMLMQMMWSAYAAAKAGVRALTRNLAAELAPRGIRVNQVTGRSGRGTPLGRMSEAEEIAKAALYLASDDAS